MGAQLLNFWHELSMYNCLTYVTCSFDNDHNKNMLKQPLHLVICLPLRTAVSHSLLNVKFVTILNTRKEFHYK
ncbi:hypothetical protein T01_129 [Trichinella spiralis]|uniref:Uncharacterized protein n=1 Tax=Trichinella spiralis TaxID=6334 RepID=A0A0V1BU07_TRISP|nr:hypothetical protein T01_129 [Trichinella spiralis]